MKIEILRQEVVEHAGEEGAAEAELVQTWHEPSHEFVVVAFGDEAELVVVHAEEAVGGDGGAAEGGAGDDSGG